MVPDRNRLRGRRHRRHTSRRTCTISGEEESLGLDDQKSGGRIFFIEFCVEYRVTTKALALGRNYSRQAPCKGKARPLLSTKIIIVTSLSSTADLRLATIMIFIA